MKRHILDLVLAILVVVALSEAQSFAGSIAGKVADPSGAALPRTKVSAAEQESNIKAKAISDSSGHYVFPSLRRGIYRSEAEAPGFRKLVNPNSEVRVNDRLEMNLTMVLGSVSETVEVNASAALLETQTGAIGSVIDNRKIVNLPLNTRNPFQLALVSPGVVPSTGCRQRFQQFHQFLDQRQSRENQRDAHRRYYQLCAGAL